MKRYTVIFETSAQGTCANLTIGVAAHGERRRPNDGFAIYESAIVRQLSIVPKGFHLRRKTTNSRRRFASSSWAAIACYSLLEKAKFTSFTEAHIIGNDFSP